MIEPLDIPHAIDLMDTVMSVNAPITPDVPRLGDLDHELDMIETLSDEQPEEIMPMTESALKSVIHDKIQSSHQWYGTGKLSSQRMEADRYYRGDPLGNEVEGRSQVVSHDLAETVDNILPSLMRIFASGDEVCSFEPNQPNDEEAASQATDYINWIFSQQNEGFMILHTWFKDALLKRNGIVKSWYEEKTDKTKEVYKGLTEQQYQVFASNPDFKVIEATENQTQEVTTDTVTGAQIPIMISTYDCQIIKTKKACAYRVENVAPDEFIIENRAASIDRANFLGQRRKMTLSELIELGFDRETVMNLPRDDAQDYTQERTERFKDEDQLPYATEEDGVDETMRKVWVTEAYLKIDFDGDGVSEWRKVTVAGDSSQVGIILDNEEVDGHPFSSLTAIPMPHKFYGMSVHDQVKSIQDVNTALWRGSLDSIYLANSPRYSVLDGQANMDDVLDQRVGGIVRMKTQGAVQPLPTVMAAPQAFQMIEYIASVKEKRTGVTAYNQGLDANTLNKTATGINMISNAGQQRVEMIARIFAETGVKDLFRKLFKLVSQYSDQKQVVRLRGKWVNIDPREWKNRMDVSVKVGIGFGNKDQQVQTAMALLNLDQQIVTLQGGVKGPLLTADNIYAKLAKLVEAAGWKSVDPYYTDPKTYQPDPPPPPPPPTPDQQKDMVALEIKKIDLQIKGIELELAKINGFREVGLPALLQPEESIPPMPTQHTNMGAPIHPRPIMTTMPQQGV